MEVFLLIPLLAALLAPMVFIGRWILSPVDRAARSGKAPVRFSIADFLCLFLAIQLPLAGAYQFVDAEGRGLFWLFTIVSWIVAPVIWYSCARALSKAGVANGRHRFIFLGLVMPTVYYGLIPFIVLSEMGAVALFIEDQIEFDRTAVWLMLAWLLMAGVYFLSGVFTRWMLRQTKAGGPATNEISGESMSAVDSALPPTLSEARS